MATTLGVARTYDLTVGVPLDIEPLISLLDPFDVPLTMGGILGHDTMFEKKKEWLDENLLTPRSAVVTTMTTTSTDLVLTSGDQYKFQTGDAVRIDQETIRLVSVSATTADDWVVTRNIGGTAGTHTGATTCIVVGVGSMLAEGSDPPAARVVDRNNRYNVSEIFGPHAVTVSGTENVVKKYGIATNEFDHQVQKNVKQAQIAYEQAVLYGIRVEDATNGWRQMGGLAYYITTNVDSSTTTLTETALLNTLQATFDAGGAPDRIVVGSKQKRLIATLGAGAVALNSGAAFQLSRNDTGRGVVVDSYISDFGRQMIILDRWCRTSDLFAFSSSQATLLTLRPLQLEMLGKTGDSIKGQVLAEKSFMFTNEAQAARMRTLT